MVSKHKQQEESLSTGEVTIIGIDLAKTAFQAHGAASRGLVPRQHSKGGKQKLAKTSKMGQRDFPRLPVNGATAVIR